MKTITATTGDTFSIETQTSCACSEEDVLDWDMTIENPPFRAKGTIQVRLVYKGRLKPIPVENLQDLDPEFAKLVDREFWNLTL